MRDFLRRLVEALGVLWTLGFICAGACIGALVGFASGGWIGAIALAFCGIVIGYFASRLVLEV